MEQEMEEVGYFLDTYALIEIIIENENYRKYTNTNNFTNYMNLLELHYIISRKFGSKKADKIIDNLNGILIKVGVNDLKDASRFREKYSKLKFSYVDCLGYITALNRNQRFLTGDKEFENFKNVVFVK